MHRVFKIQGMQTQFTLWRCLGILLVLTLIFPGCSSQYGGYQVSDDDPYFKNFEFVADAKTNTEIPQSPRDIKLFNLDGKEVPLSDYIGKRRTVLVMTRGNTVPICPFCSTLTSRYVMSYRQFQNLDTEVLIVYPITGDFSTNEINEFLGETEKRHGWKREQTELPILIDPHLNLVDYLGIRKDLSKPSTYIFDESGNITFAYVGRSITDRPSIESVLGQVKQMIKSLAKQEPSPTEAVDEALVEPVAE